MKKAVKYLSLLIMLLLVATGCGSKKDPKEMLKEALNNMKDMKSTAIKMDIEMGINAEGLSLSMDMNVEGKMDEHGNTYSKTSASMFGYNQTEEGYIINKNGFTYTYTNDGEGWEYTVEDYVEDEELSDEELDKEIDKFLDTIKDIKEEKTDRDGYTKLVLTIDYAKMNEILKETEETSEEVEFKLEKDMVLTIYIKDGYVAIIEMDVSDIMNQAMAEDGINMNMTAKLTLELNDFNKVDTIVLPQEVEENAVLESELEYEEDFEIVEV